MKPFSPKIFSLLRRSNMDPAHLNGWLGKAFKQFEKAYSAWSELKDSDVKHRLQDILIETDAVLCSDYTRLFDIKKDSSMKSGLTQKEKKEAKSTVKEVDATKLALFKKRAEALKREKK